MPRSNTKPVLYLMLSIHATARSCSVPVSTVHEWLDEGRLVLKQVGLRKRIAIGGKGGLAELIESLPTTNRKVVP